MALFARDWSYVAGAEKGMWIGRRSDKAGHDKRSDSMYSDVEEAGQGGDRIRL